VKCDSNAINLLEKKISIVLNKLNIPNAPLQDLIEKDVGKNIYTFLVLLDELNENN
jgi:hypothetical protein